MSGLVTALYVLIGFLIALQVDSLQMKKDVPYGNFPSVATLGQIRVVNTVVFSLFWLPLFATATMAVVIKQVKGSE